MILGISETVAIMGMWWSTGPLRVKLEANYFSKTSPFLAIEGNTHAKWITWITYLKFVGALKAHNYISVGW